MNRRQFLTRVLAPTAAAVAVPALARKIFLPPRGGWPVDINRYLTSRTAWFLKPDFRTEDMRYFYRERYSSTYLEPAALTEQSLEQCLQAIARQVDERGLKLSLKPTRLIVHPSWTPEAIAERLAQL